MHAVRIHARVDASHRLVLDLPVEVPEGDVEVIVLASVRPLSLPAAVTSGSGLGAVLSGIDQSVRARLSPAQTQQWIDEERGAWD